MKALWRSLKAGQFFVLSLVILTCGARISAQGANTTIPVVTIQATQPIASPGNPGVFTLFRAGNTDLTLNVYCQIGGSASNGVDYAKISNFINIPAGAVSNSVVITPLNSVSSATAKTVVLQLGGSPLMIPVNYEIGVPSNAVVYIEAGGATNLPPFVSIIQPDNGSVFYTPTNILLLAKASDPDATVTNVEFFAGSMDLGHGNPVVLDPPGVNGQYGPVYLLNWLNPAAGNYPLTAVATDNRGASSISAIVNIAVLQSPTNLPPVVRIISPPNGAVFHAPINLPLFSYANSPDGYVTSVEFFAGSNSLGFGQPIPLPTPVAGAASPVPSIYPTNIFFLIWSNAPTGTYALTALAMGNNGLTATSAPVNVTILTSSPPPTNTPVVSIVANDPVAVEGTNGWTWCGETNSTPTWAAWPNTVRCVFTNCGPKTASFTVRRMGDTNDTLTLTYAIGGTASNGVDYVTLPGYVVVPAGDHSALITVVPIDDGPPDVIKTVVLTLTPSTNTPPDYLVGCPPRAAVIIEDRCCPVPVVLPDGCFHFVTPGPDAAWFAIQYSTDMVNWTTICTNQVINGSVDFVDPDAAGNPSRFYRAIPLSGPPSQ